MDKVLHCRLLETSQVRQFIPLTFAIQGLPDFQHSTFVTDEIINHWILSL